MRVHVGSRQAIGLALGMAGMLPFLIGQGCPGPGGQDLVVVNAPSLDQTRAIGDLVTIVYDTTSGAQVSAFYDRDGLPRTGDEVVFATGLASGTNKFVQLATAGLSPGALYVGVTAVLSGQTGTAYADGKVTLVSAIQPAFISPSDDISVSPGAKVPVEFTAGSGVLSFFYRLFYDTDGQFNDNEITIEDGVSSTSLVKTEFDTTGLTAGTYRIGVVISSDYSGSSVMYASGKVLISTGALLRLIEPVGGTTISAGNPVTIRFVAVDTSMPGAQVRVFYDLDNIVGSGNEVTIAVVPASVGTTSWDTNTVFAGSYYIGVQLLSVVPPLVSYSDAPIVITDVGGGGGPGGGGVPVGLDLLTFTAPQNAVSLFEGQILTIRWNTPLAVGQATIELFREPDLNDDGAPDGEATRVVISPQGLDPFTRSFDWNTTRVRGKYYIGGTVKPVSGSNQTEYAKGPVRIRPMTFWVGEFGTRKNSQGQVIAQTGYAQGAVFKGHNFGDNLGSAMLVADDFDGDGLRDIVLAAQFGKPFFFAQGGRGAGEAYLIYGRQQRFIGDFEVNNTGQSSLPGVIFTGVLPNPNQPTVLEGKAGNSIPYTVDGRQCPPYETEGLRSMTMIPDQDGDGIREIVFGFPFCNSYSLQYQIIDRIHPAPTSGLGRLENNGHFLRGGVIIVSSRNPLMNNRNARSRHVDRVLQLQEVGQHFSPMTYSPQFVGYWNPQDSCPDVDYLGDGLDTVTFPCEGFWQQTDGTGGFSIDPPRLADPVPARWAIIDPGSICNSTFNLIDLSQIDSPVLPNDPDRIGGRIADLGEDRPACPGDFPFAGRAQVMGTGFYATGNTCGTRTMAPANPPYGCRILGQTTTQLSLTSPTTANRFAHSVSVSGDFLLIGAPLRTVKRVDVPTLPTLTRQESGEVYMLSLKRPGFSASEFYWNVPQIPRSNNLPAPHNFIISDVGYDHVEDFGGCGVVGTAQNDIRWEMARPFHIVGAAPGDRIGEVTGMGDLNNDNVPDVAVGGPGTNGGRGAVYVIYRRQPEIESDYLLERLQISPASLDRLNGLMILGRPGENLGTAIAGGGDFNDDGKADLIIGSPLATPAAGFQAGEVFVLFGGKNLLSPEGGATIPELRDSGDGVVLGGVNPGDHTGATVANAGDVNKDGVADILIAAPDASPRYDSNGDGVLDSIGLDLDGDRRADDLDGDGASDDMRQAGLVYLVFGGSHLKGTISLKEIGTANLPGLVFVGRKGGDRLGGGLTQNGLLSRGISSSGDLNGDGFGDLLLSSVLADPDGKTDAGEVYLIYGFSPPAIPVAP